MKRIAAALGHVLLLASAPALPAQTLDSLLSFNGSNGRNPSAGLIQGTDGNLYGTTESGGVFGFGTVFKTTPGGALTTIYNFCSQGGRACTDGANPCSGLIQAADGDFYGTTYLGGAAGYGTVFKLTPTGILTTLHSFCSQSGCTDGQYPIAALIQASNGNLYGTTYGLLPGTTKNNGYGTVFKVSPSGAFTPLYNFCSRGGCSDGAYPSGSLFQATNGGLYGTTSGGGIGGAAGGLGTVFEITPSGVLTTLHSFNGADGANPGNGLIQANDGNLYGMTSAQGLTGGGTVFRIALNGALTTLYGFCAQKGCPDGDQPSGPLVQGTDGNLYGSTFVGGLPTSSSGTLFAITLGGAFTTLYKFCSPCTDGYAPEGGLVQGTDGAFYGTTQVGGNTGGTGNGTVFSLSVGLGPFVKLHPAAGTVGATVDILGTGLTGATSVVFDGIGAAFSVISSSEIVATVPNGARSGTVQVVIPGGTLLSNKSFQVLP